MKGADHLRTIFAQYRLRIRLGSVIIGMSNRSITSSSRRNFALFQICAAIPIPSCPRIHAPDPIPRTPCPRLHAPDPCLITPLQTLLTHCSSIIDKSDQPVTSAGKKAGLGSSVEGLSYLRIKPLFLSDRFSYIHFIIQSENPHFVMLQESKPGSDCDDKSYVPSQVGEVIESHTTYDEVFGEISENSPNYRNVRISLRS